MNHSIPSDINSLDRLGIKSNSVFGRLLSAAGAYFSGGGGLFGIISGLVLYSGHGHSRFEATFAV
jgi:hypothetical protein